MNFGETLRSLRRQRGIGIKKLAPELGINYTYLSKLENTTMAPSADMVARVAGYFNYDYDRLLISAGKVPDEILTILRDNPEEAVAFLRHHFGKHRG